MTVYSDRRTVLLAKWLPRLLLPAGVLSILVEMLQFMSFPYASQAAPSVLAHHCLNCLKMRPWHPPIPPPRCLLLSADSTAPFHDRVVARP